MTPSARVQAAIEILDAVIDAARENGPPADVIVSRYFKLRRYAGGSDRRFVRELVFRAIRRFGDPPSSGRSAMLGLADGDEDIGRLLDGSPHGPPPREQGEIAARGSLLPSGVEELLSPLVTNSEWPALLERAPLDLRVNAARADRRSVGRQFAEAELTPLSPWGLRLPPDSKVSDHPAYLAGLVEIQDEGSQLIALACQPADAMVMLDLCAGAGGKSLALAAAAPGARIIASDTNRQRLSLLAPRAERAGANVETMLLDGGREEAGLAGLQGQCDLVLVDAPCSGSGTWRRNPEGRWRISRARLGLLTQVQERLLELAAPLVKPGGVMVYATCSIIRAEGADQARNFLGRHSSWVVHDMTFEGGRADGPGRLLTPAHDATDGFFVARMGRTC